MLVTSIILVPDRKATVDKEREWAANTKFSKLSGVFSNKYVESFRMSEDLFFQNLDFGPYFFAGHPRERLGTQEIQKLFAISILFIVFGLFKIKKDLRLFLVSFFIFAISLSVLLKDPNPTGNFLTLPILVFLAATGILSLSRDFGIRGKAILVISLLILSMEGVVLLGQI